MAATRIYILAKELGVKSTAIVKKCQDEGLDVKNHMAAISAGLAATIREWFSEGEHATTVETTEKVDLKKVRIKKKVKRKRTAKKAEAEEAKTEETKTEEAKEAEEVKKAKKVKKTKAAKKAKPTKEDAKVQAEPEPILPAGPMLKKPKPAKLTGPKVVRVEKPEPLTRARPKPKAKPRYDAPVTEPLLADAPKQLTISDRKDGKRGLKHHKPKKAGHTTDVHEGSRSTGTGKAKFGTLQRQKDLEERRARLSAAGGEGLRVRPMRKIASRSHKEPAVVARPQKAAINEPITVRSLSAILAMKSTDIISKLMQQGVMAAANETISSEVAELVALEFGTELTVEQKSTAEEVIRTEFEQRKRENLKRRSVVATMLGHVDHGKTSLLDKIRSTQVTASEAGGITQHIGAYQVKVGYGKVTFLDTPGHEAFTAMRARGADMTDVVVLVVAADDGVMPQTIEAINHAKAASVPVIVALNKTDLPGCDYNRIFSQFAEYDLTPVEWGGQTDVVKTSAITGNGIDDLLEHLNYVAELLDLKADDTIAATGWIVEAKMSPQRGPVATILIKEGVLSKGDVMLAGCAFGKVKILRDYRGKSLRKATSSMPVEVTGLSDVPQAGDRFYCLADINKAKNAAEENKTRSRENALGKRAQVTLDNLFSQIEAGSVKELNLIIRADVQGSVDVLIKYLSELSTEEVKIRILHAAPGSITEGDVVLAEASNAIIIGFNVVSEERVAEIAEDKSVEIRLYNIIYRITEDLRNSMAGMLEPEQQEKSVGRVAVRTIFKISRIGTVAGCYVSEGIAKRKAKLRLIRDNIVIRDHLSIESLKHFKDDVSEVKAGLECGIKIAKFDDIKVDDVFDFYEIVEVARTL